jgi:hypothetical protein
MESLTVSKAILKSSARALAIKSGRILGVSKLQTPFGQRLVLLRCMSPLVADFVAKVFLHS